MMAIKAALAARGEPRRIVLVPESAHGTNPATAALLGYEVKSIPTRADGTVDPEAVKAALSTDVAGAHAHQSQHLRPVRAGRGGDRGGGARGGRLFLCGRRQFQCHPSKVRIGDLGVDAMHINLHKTFSTPHGGGGPGAGAGGALPALAPSRPCPALVADGESLRLVEDAGAPGAEQTLGRMSAFHGQMGMFVRALAWMLSHGADGMRQASEDAVLSAN